MAWTIQAAVNDGYPHNENTVYALPGLTAPYPDGMWQISARVNEGYPYKTAFLQPPSGVFRVYLGARQPRGMYSGACPVTAVYFETAEIYRTGDL